MAPITAGAMVPRRVPEAMVGGSFLRPVYAASWPTGEFGGMGLEGAVRLGYRKELEAVADEAERRWLDENCRVECRHRDKLAPGAWIGEGRARANGTDIARAMWLYLITGFIGLAPLVLPGGEIAPQLADRCRDPRTAGNGIWT